MSRKLGQFVKSADTKTPATNSRGEMDKLLRRYGASAISIAEDIKKRELVVSFIVPDSPEKDAPNVPVRLPISVFRVYDMLYGQPTKTLYARGTERDYPPFNGKWSVQVFNPAGYDEKKMQQAERVAWRNLLLWVDAALSAAYAGMQTITEAFFAHTVVGSGGQRMIEVVEAHQDQLGGGVQRLLLSSGGEPANG